MKNLINLYLIIIIITILNCKNENNSLIQNESNISDLEIQNNFNKLIKDKNLIYNLDSIEKLKIQSHWSKNTGLIFKITNHLSFILYNLGLKNYARNELIKFDLEFGDNLDDKLKLQLYLNIINSNYLNSDNKFPKYNIINYHYYNKAKDLTENIHDVESYKYYYSLVFSVGVFFSENDYNNLSIISRFFNFSDFNLYYYKALRFRENRNHQNELKNMLIANNLGELPKGELGVSYRYNLQLDSAEKYLSGLINFKSKNIISDIYIPSLNLIKLYILQEKHDSTMFYINLLKKYNNYNEIFAYKSEYIKTCKNYFLKVKNNYELLNVMKDEIAFLNSINQIELKQFEILSLSDITTSRIDNYKKEINKKNINFWITLLIIIICIFLIFIYIKRKSNILKLEQNYLKSKVTENEAIIKENIYKLSEIKNINDQRNKIINKLKFDIEYNQQNFNNLKLINNLKELGNIENEWTEYKSNFNIIFPEYYNKLLEINPNLTRLDLRHASYIKLNFTTKEVAQLLNVNPQTVSTFRLRLKKKLNLNKEKSLNNFLVNLK